MRKIFFIVTLLTLGATTSAGFAALPDQSKLKKINQQINQVHTKITSVNRQKNQVERKLKRAEITIGRLSRASNSTRTQLKKQTRVLDSLTRKQASLLQQLNQQKHTLAKQLRAAYILGHQPFIKMLLNAENPTKFSRISAYYHYLTQSRLVEIQAIETTLADLRNTRAQMTQRRAALIELKNKQNKQQANLKKIYQNRKQLVQTLAQAIKTNQQKLSQLQQNKLALERVIKRVQTQALAKQKIAFAKLKGKLPWPVQGRVLKNFGTTIQQSTLKAQGMLIQAKMGTRIHAIANGKVAFANWMPGYGLLLIINHGQGYMTIYGHNQSLMVQAGDMITAGQPISTVGVSGGIHQPALYFAIRHNGKPLNPTLWCRRKSASSRRV